MRFNSVRVRSKPSLYQQANSSMYQLATFTTTDDKGQDVLIRAADGKMLAREDANGALIYPDSGEPYVVSVAVATLQTSINALWDEYIAALGDPT